MKVQYLTRRQSDTIERVEIERADDQFYWIRKDGCRLKRHRSEWQFWPTWEEAHAHLMERARKEISLLHTRLAQAHTDYLLIVALRKEGQP